MTNGFNLKTKDSFEKFDAVIIATGGRSYPKLGGNTLGYKMAKSFNHNIYNQFPAILPLNIPLKSLHKLQGIKWDCAVKVLENNKIINSSKGELLFTAYGISGPATLDISRTVNEKIIQQKNIQISIDLFPELEKSQLKDLLNSLWIDQNKEIGFSLLGILKDKIPDFLLQTVNINSNLKVGQLNDKMKDKILHILKNIELNVGKIRNSDDAVVTAGGIDVNEIDPKTMESKLVNGLYFAGEVLDIDGISGGYNLQFAWSTGAIAGMSQ